MVSASGTLASRKQELAALIHLCGAGAGEGLRAWRGAAARPGERCGDHERVDYLTRVDTLTASVRPPGRGRLAGTPIF